MCFPVASNSTLLTLPLGIWQIMQNFFRYRSDFDLVVYPSEFWCLELKDGLSALLLIIDASSSSIAAAYLFLALLTFLMFVKFA